MSNHISVVRADITTLKVDAIVNAANTRLIPGGGVDGAINRAAGPELAKAMAAIGKCSTGKAVITSAFKLHAKYVIHTVAPIFAHYAEPEVWRLLSNCYVNTFALARKHQVTSIAFPSLGTGVYGIPIAEASRIAVLHADHGAKDMNVIFCCFSDHDAEIYRARLAGRKG